MTAEGSEAHISGAEPAREHLGRSSHFLLLQSYGEASGDGGLCRGPEQGTVIHQRTCGFRGRAESSAKAHRPQ